MPNKCSVVGCNGNYASGPKVSVFKFPKEEELLKKWINAIPRENFTVTKNSRVSAFLL
jgi:hypothetical protein